MDLVRPPCCTVGGPACFFCNHTAPTEIYPLSLHDALPIFDTYVPARVEHIGELPRSVPTPVERCLKARRDRKSTRLNSSHVESSYAVFCLKKKKVNMEDGLMDMPWGRSQVHPCKRDPRQDR